MNLERSLLPGSHPADNEPVAHFVDAAAMLRCGPVTAAMPYPDEKSTAYLKLANRDAAIRIHSHQSVSMRLSAEAFAECVTIYLILQR